MEGVGVAEEVCFGATRRTSANGCFSLPDPVSERRVGERDSAPTQEKPTSPGRSTDKKAKDDSRRVAKSTQDLSDVSMDEVGIPLRVRVPPKSSRGLLSARDKCAPLRACGPLLGLQRPREEGPHRCPLSEPAEGAEPQSAVLQPPSPPWS